MRLSGGLAFWGGRKKNRAEILGSGNKEIKMTDTHKKTSSGDVRSHLIGAWRLVSWFERTSAGEVTYPLGKDATGQIIYSDDGHVAAQLVRRDVPRFMHDDWRMASADECAQAWKSYFGYFGTFSIMLKNRRLFTMSRAVGFRTSVTPTKSGFLVLKKNALCSMPTRHGERSESSGRRRKDTMGYGRRRKNS